MPNFDGPQTRSFEIRAQTEGRTITALAVPYDEEITLWDGYREKFAPGSIEDAGAILRYGHAEPLGVIVRSEDTPAGREIEGRISKTARGDEIATLISDGVLTKMSIGFDGIERSITENEDGSTLITWLKVRAREYSVVEFPAYDSAAIESIRSKPQEGDTPMPQAPVTREDLDALERSNTEAIADLERSINALNRSITSKDEGAELPLTFRSFGEYARALANPDAATHEMATRAFTGSVVGDSISRPGWLGVLEKRMTAKQPVVNMFTHTTNLPAEGMTVEYGVAKDASTVKVAKQAAEGDNLTAGKTGTYEIESAPVQTFGGYGELSRQAIDRATVSLLDDLFADQAYVYAAEMEAATKKLFTDTVTANEATPVATITGALTVNALIENALALIDAYDATPYVMDGIAVSPTIFLELAKLNEERKAMAFTGTPTDKQGTLTIAEASGNILNIPVRRVANWTGKHLTGYSADAIQIKEQPGAPLRLQAENIVNLTKGFSVYGYAAIFAPKTGLIKPIKFA